MTISVEERKHGAVLLRLMLSLSENVPDVRLSVIQGESRSAYKVRVKCVSTDKQFEFGLFVKICRSRRSPWRYTFNLLHQEEIQQLYEQCGQAFVILVAGEDGFAALNFEQLKEVLDQYYEEVEWVSVSRRLHENYRVSGQDGSLSKPLPRNVFPRVITEYVEKIVSA